MKTKLLSVCIVVFTCLIFSGKIYAQRDAGGSSSGSFPEAGSSSAAEQCITEPPPESFKRNNGDGTCGKDGQIRLKFNLRPSQSPVLIGLMHMDGSTVTNINLPIGGDDSDLAKKKYASYCIDGANISPAKKLIAVFRFPGNCQEDIMLSENK